MNTRIATLTEDFGRSSLSALIGAGSKVGLILKAAPAFSAAIGQDGFAVCELEKQGSVNALATVASIAKRSKDNETVSWAIGILARNHGPETTKSLEEIGLARPTHAPSVIRALTSRYDEHHRHGRFEIAEQTSNAVTNVVFGLNNASAYETIRTDASFRADLSSAVDQYERHIHRAGAIIDRLKKAIKTGDMASVSAPAPPHA